MSKRIARVFPRGTAATPNDPLAFEGMPGLMGFPEVDEIHVSVTFTCDRREAEEIAFQLELLGVPVKVGGPAYGSPPGDFTPGMYLKHGYTITSRGCPNHCRNCMVPRREGPLRELPIKDGWNILDNNLLACSEAHIRAVFDMLKRQPQRPLFTGGLETRQLLAKPWTAELLREAKPKRMYFAYDHAADLEPLQEAGKLLRAVGFTQASHRMACYVLIGQKGDSFSAAEKRLRQAWEAGFWPYAMLWRGEDWKVEPEWQRFYSDWRMPQMVAANLKGILPRLRDGD